MNNNRRKFLKIASLSAFALSSGIASMGLSASEAEAKLAPGFYDHGPKTLHAKRWAMVIDTRQFKSPEDYTPLIRACHREHNVPDIPSDKNIKWLWIDSFEHVFPDDMNAHMTKRLQDAGKAIETATYRVTGF